MLKINSAIIWGKFFCCCCFFQKLAFEHHSLNANKNNSCIEMSLVLNLKTGRRWSNVGAYHQMRLHPSIKDGREERRMESWRFIPATTQDPAQPYWEEHIVQLFLKHQRMSDSGGLRIMWGAYFDGAMLIKVSCRDCAPKRSHSALWTSWKEM